MTKTLAPEKKIHIMTEVKLGDSVKNTVVEAASSHQPLKALVMGSRGMGTMKRYY